MESANELQTRVVIRESPKMLLLGVASAWLIAFAMWTGSDRPSYGLRTLAWAILLTAILGRGVYLAGTPPAEGSPLPKSRQLKVNGAAAAVMWGLSSSFMLPGVDLEHEVILILAIALITMAGSFGRAVYMPIIQVFVLITTFIFAGGLLALPGTLHRFIGLGYLLFGIVITLFGRAQENALHRERELNVEIDRLLKETAARRQEAEQHLLRAEAARRESEQARALAVRATTQAESAATTAESATRRAEEATHSKQRFLASVSHDLRQPLHALVQYVAHLARTNSDARQVHTIEKIGEAVESMNDLLNAVFDFSRISAGSVKANFQTLNADDVLRRLYNHVRAIAEAKGLAVKVRFGGGHILSDHALLDRVLCNIAQNAVRYTEFGTIVIRAAPRGDIVRILISDSGVGIEARERERIFDDYYQAGNQAHKREPGLGLGLAIVRELSTILRAKIRLRSRVNIGSTFAIELPRSYPADAAFQERFGLTTVDYLQGAFVVSIDDDRSAADGIATTLRDFGCRTLSATSCSDAVEQLAAIDFAPQVIVTDYRLGGDLTGLDAITTLKSRQIALYGEQFPLTAILVSGDTSPQGLKNVENAGYIMLYKPVNPRDLYRELNYALASQSKAE